MATKFQKTKRMKATLLKGRRTRTATHQTMTFHRMRAKQQQQQQVTSWRLNRVMDVTLLLQSPNQLQLLTLLFEARENTFKSLLIVSSQTDLPPQLFWTKAARLAFSTVRHSEPLKRGMILLTCDATYAIMLGQLLVWGIVHWSRTECRWHPPYVELAWVQ